MQAVCFDFDGTLVDSEPIHFAAWQQTLASWDQQLVLNDYLNLYSGTSTQATAAHLIQSFHLPLQADELAAIKTRRFLSLLPITMPTANPGAEAVLHQMQTLSLRCALVTGSRQQEIQPVLECFGWARYFDVIVTRDDVIQAKPSPEPYLKALSLLNVEAEQAVAVEDSPTGIRSARDAGLKVLVVDSPSGPKVDTSTNPYLFTSLSAVGRYISKQQAM